MGRLLRGGAMTAFHTKRSYRHWVNLTGTMERDVLSAP